MPNFTDVYENQCRLCKNHKPRKRSDCDIYKFIVRDRNPTLDYMIDRYISKDSKCYMFVKKEGKK